MFVISIPLAALHSHTTNMSAHRSRARSSRRWSHGISARRSARRNIIANSHNVAAAHQEVLRARFDRAALPCRYRSFQRRSRRRRLLSHRLASTCRTSASTLRFEPRHIAGVPLLIAGTGPAASRAERGCARHDWQRCSAMCPIERVNELLGAARAAILPGEEDFGLVPLEAAASGRPTIAYRGGGAIETVVEGRNGGILRFSDGAVAGRTCFAHFDERRYDPQRLRAHAQAFAPDRFIARLREIVEDVRGR